MRYIKTSVDNNIIDLFHEWQKSKFDGNEIYLDDNEGFKINGKSISSEYGVPIFNWINSSVVDRTALDIDGDADAVARIKQKYLSLLPDKIVMSLLNGNRTLSELQTAWANFKSNASTWDTLTKVETAWNNALTYSEG